MRFKTIAKTVVGIAVLAFVGLFAIAIVASKEQRSANSADRKPVLSSSAHDIHAAYHVNEVAADQRFKDKWLEVSGSVAAIRKGALGGIYVELVTDNPFQSMSCELDRSNESVAAELKPKEVVRVVGRCAGMVLGSVHFSDCSLTR